MTEHGAVSGQVDQLDVTEPPPRRTARNVPVLAGVVCVMAVAGAVTAARTVLDHGTPAGHGSAVASSVYANRSWRVIAVSRIGHQPQNATRFGGIVIFTKGGGINVYNGNEHWGHYTTTRFGFTVGNTGGTAVGITSNDPVGREVLDALDAIANSDPTTGQPTKTHPVDVASELPNIRLTVDGYVLILESSGRPR